MIACRHLVESAMQNLRFMVNINRHHHRHHRHHQPQFHPSCVTFFHLSSLFRCKPNFHRQKIFEILHTFTKYFQYSSVIFSPSIVVSRFICNLSLRLSIMNLCIQMRASAIYRGDCFPFSCFENRNTV